MTRSVVISRREAVAAAALLSLLALAALVAGCHPRPSAGPSGQDRSDMSPGTAAALAPYLPKWLARPGKRLLSETLALLMQRHVYDLGSQHLRAFACGVKLARAAAANARAACVPPAVAPAESQGGPAAHLRQGPRPLTSLAARAYESARRSAADAA